MTSLTLDEKWGALKNQIKFLVYECDDFIVFVDQDINVYWETADSYDSNGGHKDVKAWNEFLNFSAYVEISPCSHLNNSVKLDFKRLVAEAAARALNHEYLSASKMLDDAVVFLNARNQETSRFWYVSASGFLAFIISIVGISLWGFKPQLVQTFGDDLFWIFISSCVAAQGALLSIILRIGSTNLDCSSGKSLHYLEASCRIVAGCISGAAAMLAIKAGVIGPAILSVNDSISGQMLFVLAAGSSERLIPSIISKFDDADIKSEITT